MELRFDNLPAATLSRVAETVERHLAETLSRTPVWGKYVDLGVMNVAVNGYSADFLPHCEKQLAYTLKDSPPIGQAGMPRSKLAVWQENDFAPLIRKIAQACGVEPVKWSLYRLMRKNPNYLQIFPSATGIHRPYLTIDGAGGVFKLFLPAADTAYYAVKNLASEEFIKHGHIFVQQFSEMLHRNCANSALVHGAAIGIDGKGVLLCARGQRGKSTLAVRAMLDGFDYVSDDYLVLSRENNEIFVDPIYSIITLSPMMYGDLYKSLHAKFVSNNARKDKYVFNIAAYHDKFRTRYPVSLGMFPQIVEDAEPSVEQCAPAGKGRAIAQLIHSTIAQMGDRHSPEIVNKLLGLVKDLPFYQINLCRDIDKNLQCLREFLRTGNSRPQQTVDLNSFSR